MKKKSENGWILPALIWMAIFLFARVFASTGTEFQLKYDSEVTRVGYENAPAWITVWAGRGLQWDSDATINIFGWVAFACIPLGLWYAGTGKYYSKKTGKVSSDEWKKWVAIIAPIVATAILFFASYSSKLDLGAYNGPYNEFVEKFQVSPEQQSKIKAKGGTGAYLYKDENGLLKAHFESLKK